MRGFFVFSVLYLAVSVLLVEIFRGDGTNSAARAIYGTSQLLLASDRVAVVAVAMGIGVLFMARIWGLGRVLGRLAYAIFGTLCFLSAFGLVKTLLPDIVPFYADTAFANFDRALHGGIDPWRLTHEWAARLPMRYIEPLYLQVWIATSPLFPVILALLDTDRARVRRFLTLYAVAWIGLGNFVALAGMSAGPVYYDRLLGTDRFAELNATLGLALTNPYIPVIQDGLWQLYIEGRQIVGSGISAFPSVHVATAGVVALYLAERLPPLAPVAVAYLGATLFLSVFTGYHYAIDGYASIAVIGLVWAVMRRRTGQAAEAPMAQVVERA